jgi:uncharacterized protein
MNQEELEKIQSLLRPIFEKNKVKQVILFGSAARHTETRKSDLDLLIVVESDRRFFDRFEAFDEMHALFKGRQLDLLIYTPEELNRMSDRPFIRSVLKEGQIIYERREE